MNTKETLREEWEKYTELIRQQKGITNIEIEEWWLSKRDSELKDLIKIVEGMKQEMYSDGSGNMQDPAVANEDGYNNAIDWFYDIISKIKELL